MSGTETTAADEAQEPGSEEPLTVDASPGGERPPTRRRRTALRTHRLRTGLVALVIVAAAVAVPLLVVKATRTIANSKAGHTIDSSGVITSRLPDTPAALLVTVGPDGTVAGLTVLALDGSGSGGTAVVVPAGTEVPAAAGHTATRLAGAFDNGGLDAEQEALEGVLGITTSLSEQVDDAGLTALLQPYAPIRVTLDDPALGTGADGRQVVLQPAGPVDLTAAQAAQLLVARGPNESEIARLPRTAAIWTAVLAAGAGRDVPAPSASRPATWAAQLAAVASGHSAAQALSVQPVLDAVANPDGLDLLRPDDAAMKLLLAQVMPGAVSPASDNIRLRVVNATGDPKLLADVVTRLVSVGANVVIVSEEPASTATLIEYQDQRNQAEAETYVPVVGRATVRLADERIDGIDATIVVGQDFATFARQQPLPPETSTSPSTTTPSSSSTGP
jgi:LytR cell envelope-related transcriptional attenuator